MLHSREIAAYGGVVNTMPKFAAFALLFLWLIVAFPVLQVLSVSGW